MELSMRKINALFKKEIKDLGKNKNVSIMYLLPIFFSFVYSKMLGASSAEEGIGKSDILIMCLGMSLTLVTGFCMAMLIAEEKEKNTLRTLMLSGVSAGEFIAGKALITLLLTEIIDIIIFYLIGIEVKYLGIYVLLTTPVIFTMIELGAVIGILSPNQMSTGVIGMPILFAFLMLPIFSRFNETIENIAAIIPNTHMNTMLEKSFKGEGLGAGDIKGIAIMIAWIIIGALIFAYVYKKKGLDK
ncbi:ABC transporter permease [Clostridium sp. YIM B02551]|uniref:ABC transporter permease n=1 Tax=Clostridium sp. YIM B02551 TaxID=2910679 RepID=UPI001EEC3DAA|nr:ABC transporter permease [Clostridium sp. YIM B02551]